MVAGPVSTRMAQLEAAAGAGEAFVDDRLAAALPSSWTALVGDGATRKLRLGRVPPTTRSRPAAPVVDVSPEAVAALLPTQFTDLVDSRHRAGELKQVAMAFIRLNGTDELLEAYGIDETHRILAELSEIVDDCAAEHDVCWLETQAEANSVRWTLVAGASKATERDAERLLRVVRRIADRSPRPLRIGVNLGVVYVGDMGHPERCTFIVMGDTTNLAARLMAKAQPGEIIAGDRVHRACSGRFTVVPLVPFTVKGKREPVHAFQIGPLHHAPIDLDDPASAPAVLVGRDADVAALTGAVGDGVVVDVVGDAGMGKSSLIRPVQLRVAARRWFVVRAEPQEVDAPYAVVRRLVRSISGVDDAADAQRAGVTLTSFVRQVAPRLRPWLPLIADVAGVLVASTDEVEDLHEDFRVERLRFATAELIATALGRDDVVAIEDVQWTDDGSSGIIDTLVRLPERSTPIVLTRRPGGWQPDHEMSLEVEPLDDAAATELLLAHLPAQHARDATVERLRRIGAGNPLYLVELARALTTMSADSVLPDSIERLLAARIDQLPVSGRELVRDASVLGSSVDRRLASRVLERPDLIATHVWQREVGDLMVRDGEVMRFEQDLVRVAAYEGLSVRRRAELHRRAGDEIESWEGPSPVPDRIAALAYHAIGSGIDDRIVRWGTEAAEAAITVGAMEIAAEHLVNVGRAQRRAGHPATERAVTMRRLAFAAERAGQLDAALAALDQASALVRVGERGVVAVDRARVLEKLGRYRAALVTTANALRRPVDPVTEAHLLLSRATIRNFQGRWRECLTLCHRVLDDVEVASELALRARAHVLAEWCSSALGLPERAHHEAEAEALLLELDDAVGLGNLYLNRGESAWLESRVDDAVADFGNASKRFAQAGDVVGSALADNNLAEVLTFQSRLDEAEERLTNARRVMQAANYPHGVCTAMSGLSRIAAWRGHHDEAMELQRAAISGFRELDAADFVADSLVRLVEIHVLAGDVDVASVVDDAAAAIDELGGVPVLSATLARLRGRASALGGRADEARTCYVEARERATTAGYEFEAILTDLALAGLDGDEGARRAALGRLSALGVLEPPPTV
jgi:class 3 adenylate cyclase/tetratricopeptide (TPR) repeat protein